LNTKVLQGSVSMRLRCDGIFNDQFITFRATTSSVTWATCVPNLKSIALTVCEILSALRNFEIGSRHPRHVHLGAICNLWTRTARSLSVCDICRA